jgi:hypothetical protein
MVNGLDLLEATYNNSPLIATAKKTRYQSLLSCQKMLAIFMQDNDFMYQIGVGGFGSSLGIYKELA